VGKEIARRLEVPVPYHLVQRGPALLLARVHRRPRVDEQLHGLEAPARRRGVQRLHPHRVLRRLRDVGAAGEQ